MKITDIYPELNSMTREEQVAFLRRNNKHLRNGRPPEIVRPPDTYQKKKGGKKKKSPVKPKPVSLDEL